MSVFGRFAPRLQQAIVSRLGWSSLRPVQELTGEALLAGHNAVVLAPTAGGKTEAAFFPVLSGLIDDPPQGLAVIYVAPIKALLNNQGERLGLYTEMVGLRRFVWHGDVASHARGKFLREPADVLMTTPESLEVMLVSQRVDEAALFADLRVIVVDEIHALAGSDRGAHLMSVVERIAKLSRHDIQRVGLSATVGNPETILGWLQGSSTRSAEVVDAPKVPQQRELLVVHREELPELARDASKLAKGNKSLFFCQSRSFTEAIAEQLRRVGTTVYVHHSSVSREERELAEERFHEGSDACIVCTSTLELGIDVGDLDRVLQANAPGTVSSFMQRMGRTGRRAGQLANTTFFCETPEGVLQAIALIELAKQGWVENVDVEDRAWSVLIHQILAMALAGSGVTVDDAWGHLSRVPDFAGIHRAEVERLVSWMLRDRALDEASGRLLLGPKTERRFGRRNFMELYAVFSSPQTYAVITGDGQELGSLNQDFVDRLVDETSCFLLGGRPWLVNQVLHDLRQVRVQPAPRGKEPTWGGFLPQFLGFDLCQQILRVLCSDEGYRYLHDSAQVVLDERREAFAGVVDLESGGLEVDEGEIRWWTFAGGRINSTLRYALSALNSSWKVVPDNFLVAIRGENVRRSDVERALAQLGELEFWENDRLWQEVAEELPGYRLSKFQSLMPPWVEREVLAEYLLDVEGAWRWVNRAMGGEAEAGEGLRAAFRRGVSAAVAEIERRAVPAPPPATYPRPSLPIRWVRSDAELAELRDELGEREAIGLDVETTLGSRALCLVQVATDEYVALIDALEIEDLTVLDDVLGSEAVTKVIHNASFERSVLDRHGVRLVNVLDTLEASREARGRDADGGHSLKAVCRRELGLELDKTQQTSNWQRRPLDERQVAYAALDAEVLLKLCRAFGGE